jgi:hypothetical protein
MVEELLVDNRTRQIEDGRALITGLVRTGFDVAVAFWVRTSGARASHLYVASPQIILGKLGDLPLLVYKQLQQIPNTSIDLGQVRLIPKSDPAAQAAVAIRDRPPSNSLSFNGFGMSRLGEHRIGDFLAEWSYIYERISTDLTREEVIQRVVNLIERPGPQSPSKLTLRDGSVMQGIPIGLETSVGGVAVSLLDSVTNSRHAILAKNVTNIE